MSPMCDVAHGAERVTIMIRLSRVFLTGAIQGLALLMAGTSVIEQPLQFFALMMVLHIAMLVWPGDNR